MASLNRATIEHLENGIVTSSVTVSDTGWLDAIVLLGAHGGREEWFAACAVLFLAESLLENCGSLEEVIANRDDIQRFICFALSLDCVMTNSKSDELWKRLDELLTSDYWEDSE